MEIVWFIVGLVLGAGAGAFYTALVTINKGADAECSWIDVGIKYHIGDTVWVADYAYDTYCPCRIPCVVDEIEVRATKKKQTIYYHVVMDYDEHKIYGKYAEKECFNSYEGCQQWCKEHNTSF